MPSETDQKTIGSDESSCADVDEVETKSTKWNFRMIKLQPEPEVCITEVWLYTEIVEIAKKNYKFIKIQVVP